jgi:RNA polymerase sigma-70 factor (ECF subfamily)
LAKELSNIIEFTLIYNRFKSRLFNYVRKMVNDNILTEDIIQTVFLRFFENMPDIKNKDRYEFWLFKTARNEVFNHYRSKKIKNNVFESIDIEKIGEPEKEGIEYVFDQKEMHNLIIKELNTFPVEQRESYLLKEYSQLSYREIAELLGIDEDIVKSRLFKTRRKLVEKISKILLYGVE